MDKYAVWVKAMPNKKGYWLRINASNRPQIHFIQYMNRGDGEKLFIEWGWGGDTKFEELEVIKDKLEFFYWMYLPLPDESTVDRGVEKAPVDPDGNAPVLPSITVNVVKPNDKSEIQHEQ